MRTQPAYLYRAFDADGSLLYVGISTNWTGRFNAHQNHSEWWPLAVSYTVLRYPDEASAREAERTTIHTEGPRFNIAGSQVKAPRTARCPEQPEWLNLLVDSMVEHPVDSNMSVESYVELCDLLGAAPCPEGVSHDQWCLTLRQAGRLTDFVGWAECVELAFVHAQQVARAREHHHASTAADDISAEHRESRDLLIRKLRGDGWTYASLAEAVGCSPELIAHIVKRRLPNPT